MHGEPKYPPDFGHFGYVNPDAPKGGTARLSAEGGYDSFNQFIVKGRPAAGLALLYDTLMVNAGDEAFTEYGRRAETVAVPEARSWDEFTLHGDARRPGGTPIT